MFLFKQRVRGIPITHPLSTIDASIENPEELAARLRAGEKEAVEEAVAGYARFAISIASQYACFARNKTDDLVSEAMSGIVQACAEVTGGRMAEGNLTTFVASRIHAVLAKFIRKDRTVYLPQQVAKQARKAAVQDHVRYEDVIDSRGSSGLFDIRDMLQQAIRTNLEEQVIHLRSERYVDKEIAGILGRTLTEVWKARTAVQQRYEKLEGDGE